MRYILLQVNEFKYLRVLFTSEGKTEKEIFWSSRSGTAVAVPYCCGENRVVKCTVTILLPSIPQMLEEGL